MYILYICIELISLLSDKSSEKQRTVFYQTVRRGSFAVNARWGKWSVHYCTKWLVRVTVVSGGWGVESPGDVGRVVSEFSGVVGKRGRGARTGGSSASGQPDVWSCPSVCWSSTWDSAVSFLMAADWRSCVSGGWDHLQCRGLLRVRRVL